MTRRRAWIVVADRRNARVFFHSAPGASLEDTGVEFAFAEALQHSDRPGRVHERVGAGRHGMEAPTSPAALERDTAGRTIGDAVSRGFQDGRFERLVIAAAPDLIGAIRPHLPDALRDAATEIRHRWVHLTPRELAQRLDDEGVLGRVA